MGGGARKEGMRDKTKGPTLILDLLSLLFHVLESLKNNWNCYGIITK